MSLSTAARNKLRKVLTKENDMVLAGRVPGYESLERKFRDIGEAGLYLHIPFCRQICPYCPYNKEIYEPETAERYVRAVKKEIDFYAGLLGDKPLTTFYIGGGTPTTMLHSGLADILEYIYKKFNMQCDIHMESHPNDLSEENLDFIKSLNITNLSVGVESLQHKYLEILKRPYTAAEAKAVIERAVNKGFKCFNTDFIFALPGQTYGELEQAAKELAGTGIDQVAAYPLFYFPYTTLGEASRQGNYDIAHVLKRRKMLRIIEDVFYTRDYERTSVWAFTRQGVPKYCSVTVPLYIGLGASGSSYLRDVFYLNTFNVAEYIKRLEDGRSPIALSLDLSENMQMAWWVYWRVYETRFRRSDFKKRFGRDFNALYGKYFKLFSLQGMIESDDGDEIVLNDRGSFWLHALEDIFSLNYISKLWGTSKEEPWPEKVVL
jgi:coproporphyrinogen III oxidase-like Fe-S oxidoreductase